MIFSNNIPRLSPSTKEMMSWEVKSDIAHKIINEHPLVHILDTRTLLYSSCVLLGHEKWSRETHSFTHAPGLSTLSDLSLIVEQPPATFLCCPTPPSHHPSILTTVYVVPVIYFLLPSTPFWPNSSHPFFPHNQTIWILSDPLYSLTPFLFQLSYKPNSMR